MRVLLALVTAFSLMPGAFAWAAEGTGKEPIATLDGEFPGITMEVMEFKRTSGDTLTLKMAVVNGSEEELTFGGSFAEHNMGSDYGTVSGIHLIDADGRKKHFVVRDKEGAPLCSRDIRALEAGKRAVVWVKFPAPPASVEKLTIEVPHFIPAEDVPIG